MTEDLASTSQPIIIQRCDSMRAWVVDQQRDAHVVGVVPTMGALHDGHLSLVEAAQQECSKVVVTIFVNPTQFGPKEDFSSYPRTLDADVKKLAAFGVDAVFAPPDHEMYPAGFSTSVQPPEVALTLEGRVRPDHFQGVTTVVLKLLNTVPADFAYFGQKDYQQSLVIKQMAVDLNVPITIHTCPTVREHDGLAMSSRNVHLSKDQRAQAVTLSQCLYQAETLIRQGESEGQVVMDQMRQQLLAAGVDQIDYSVVADPQSLVIVDQIRLPVVALVAARVGQTRLIDNLIIE